MEMVEVKASELIGAALDKVVAHAEGIDVFFGSSGDLLYPNKKLGDYDLWSPSTQWFQGGPLIEKYAIGFVGYDADNWLAFASSEDIVYQAIGGTHLVAACRLIVSAKLGETVLVPKELVK